MSTGVKLESVVNLLDKEFLIRSYQRGYRWDEDQVKDLLNDFKEFIDQPNKSEEEFYCLQPIVVKQLSNTEKEKLSRLKFKNNVVYEIIDGQQRITTITILLHYLKEAMKNEILLSHLPSITYEVREKSKEVLSNFSEYIHSSEKQTELENNIDFYHMRVVYDTILDWFESKDQYRIPFLKLLTSYKINNVKVIWYEVEEKDNSIEVFRRFNVGKIPLTNAELIKALFLKEDENIDNAIKFSISKEWQYIENQLQSTFFWSFLNPSKNYASRREYIFDLIFSTTRKLLNDKDKFDNLYGTDKHKVFRYYASTIKSSENLLVVWDQVNEVFERLLQWYNNFEHYHYIGYIQNREGKTKNENIVLDILSYRKPQSNSFFSNKQELTDYLVGKISSYSASYFTEKRIALDYGSNKTDLRNLFFLFNIETCVKLSKSGNGEEIYRLPFNLYGSINYDIEHIDSKNEKELSDLKTIDKINYLEDLETDFGFEIGKTFEETISPLFTDSSLKNKWVEQNIDFSQLDSIFTSVLEIIDKHLEKDSDKLRDKNVIGNLTILNESINRSYGNSYFNTKRRLIIQHDKEGTYVPLATKNAFLKYYSGNTKKHTRWSEGDAANYRNEMERILSKFMK